MANGAVSIRTFALKSRRSDETEEQWMERIMNRNPRSSSNEIIDSSELPQSKEDRDAWTGEKGQGISIDEVKAVKLRTDKEIKMKIDKKIRRKAIDDLIDEGELPEDYEE